MAQYVIKLKIADIIIQIQSRFPPQRMTEEEKRKEVWERFDNFFYRGRQKPDIVIDIVITDKLPEIRNARPIFITTHFQDGKENWRLIRKGDTYIYKSPLRDKKQLIQVNRTFDRVNAYLIPKNEKSAYEEEIKEVIRKNRGFTWDIADIVYDFLQVLLINYFAQRNLGIFTHAIGIKDLDSKGLLFAGKSGAGKSTTARLWHEHSKAMVLNDDRIIVRKKNGRFFIYGSPWHGEFSDYLASHIESAPLKKLFFIHHAAENTLRELFQKEAFHLLYPALFPTLWDKGCLSNIASFCQDLIKNIPCHSLGFVNDRRVIEFVRKIDANRR